MTCTLYGRPWSGSLCVEFLLEEMGLPYERALVTGYRENIRPPEFAEINPLRAVPALKLGDGSVLTESAAILMFLAETHGSGIWSPAIGDPARAPYLRWFLYLSASLYPSAMQVFHPENYTDIKEHEAGVAARGQHVTNRQWAVVREALGGREQLVGTHMTALDIYLAMFARWFDGMEGIDDDESMAAFRQNMLTRPAIKGVISRHESGIWA
ncbi:MAG: glutathione S-transferase family protein [Rhodospirillales bacterium]|nr:glutathione S-transferase family protein [Rhodospirillales bacterium]